MPRAQTITITPADVGTALQVGGRPLPPAHASIASILASRLGQAHRDLLATPEPDPGGGMRWTTPLAGVVQRVDALSPDERSRVERRAEQLLGDIRGLAAQLQAEGGTGAVVGAMLAQATRVPPGTWLHAVDGKPVLVLWGHDAAGAAGLPAAAALAPAPMPGGVASAAEMPAAAASVTPTATATPVASGRWGGPSLLVALLLAVLLLALLVMAWRAGEAPPVEGVDQRLSEAETEQRRLEAALAQRRAQEPRFICAAPPPPQVASAPAPEPAAVASAPEPAASDPQPPVEVASAPARPRAACPGARPAEQAPQVVIVFDTSPSMNYSLNASRADIERAENESQQAARLAALGLYQGPDPMDRVRGAPQRITPARQSAVTIADGLPSDVGAGLVLVDSCRDGARTVGYFEPSQRGRLLARLRGLSAPKPDPSTGTPLADGLAQGARLVDGVKRDAMMLVISDGEESCGGDPCATAATIARARPRLRINVLDITGTGAGNCVARATGGRVFTARNAREVATMMKRAAQDAMAPADCR